MVRNKEGWHTYTIVPVHNNIVLVRKSGDENFEELVTLFARTSPGHCIIS